MKCNHRHEKKNTHERNKYTKKGITKCCGPSKAMLFQYLHYYVINQNAVVVLSPNEYVLV